MSLAITSFLLAATLVVQPEPRVVRSTAEVEAGTFLVASESGYLAVPAVATEAHVRIHGIVARTEVVQRFVNPQASFAEGTYVFPLPEGAAVDRMRLQIGERVIEGELHEKAAAQKIFEQAKSEGKKASLLEQARPNLFSTRVANLGPREELVVRIEYQEVVRYDGGKFSLRFPLAITPRYTPPSAGFLMAPPPTGDLPAVAAEITVELDAGFEIADLTSLHHQARIEGTRARRHLTLAEHTVPPDRDFVMEWRPRLGGEPQAAFFRQAGDGEAFGLLMLMPPAPAAASASAPRLPRETIFVVDSSGSMEGSSMVQAQRAVVTALGSLHEQDRFDVIDFDDGARMLFGSAQPATAARRQQAIAFVEGLSADGGTNIASALELALRAEASGDAVRQVVFITDGAVGNELELFRTLHARLGRTRLYTVGIGGAPNTWFMKEAAEAGRGTFTFIGDVREVEAKMGALFRKIEAPVLTDLALDFGGARVRPETFPDRLPDLFAGEPVMVAVRFDGAVPDAVRLIGRQSGAAFEKALDLGGLGATAAGLDKLWARGKIEALTDRMGSGTPEEEVRPEIVRVALRHGLVSAYTSLIAVDRVVSRRDGEPLASVRAPAPSAPAVDPYAATMPQTATAAELSLIVGAALLLLALLALRAPRPAR